MKRPETDTVAGVGALAERYEALILDLWGVLHDGLKPYPEVIACLKQLRAAGKRLCALSNAPRRVDRIARHMHEMGLPTDLVDAIHSSGEATYEALATDGGRPSFGQRCLHIGAPKDAHVAATGSISLVDTPRDADFILCTGVLSLDDTLDDYRPILGACLRHQLPLVCANPDLKVMEGDRWKLCAGSLAKHYEDEGGKVIYFGKPHRPVYDRCIEILGAPRERVLAVGDSFRTDVAGANGAGISCLLVAGGLNADALLDGGDSIDLVALDGLIGKWGHRPRFVVPRFVW